jgi:AraC-like DNA-binding protein
VSALLPDNYPRIYLYRRLVQAKLFIDTHFAEQIDLDSIADEAFFSKFHFIRLFKQIYERTPHQYLISVRIAGAKQLLRSGMSATDTCYAVGFESVSSFTGLFKRQTGVTPSVYRQQQLDLQSAIRKAPLNFIPNCFAETHGWDKTAILKKRLPE